MKRHNQSACFSFQIPFVGASLGLASAMLLGHSTASAAISLTDLTPSTENFDSFDGTAGSVPTNFVAGSTFTFGSPGRTLTSGISNYDTTPGWYALNDNGSLSDIAFGGRTDGGSAGEGTLTVEVTNNTGMTIPGLSLSFQVEQYSGSLSGNQLDVLASLDNSTFNTTNLSGDISTSIPTGMGNTVFADPTITARSVGYDASIADGSSVFLQFFWNQTAGGQRPHFGIDDFSVQAVPEPSSALLGLIGAGLLLRRRR